MAEREESALQKILKEIVDAVTETRDTIVRERVRIISILSILLFFLAFNLFSKNYISGNINDIQDILISLSIELGGAIIIFILLDSGIEKINELSIHGIRERRELDTDRYISNIKSAKEQVVIYDIWMETLINRDDNRDKFLRTIKQAISINKVNVKFLIIQPHIFGAKQRAAELKRSNVHPDSIHLMVKAMNRLDAFMKEVKSEIIDDQNLNDDIIEIRLYDATPSISMHLWDGVAYWSFYPVNGISTVNPQLRVPLKTPVGDFLMDKFNDVWTSKGTLSIQEYMVKHKTDIEAINRLSDQSSRPKSRSRTRR